MTTRGRDSYSVTKDPVFGSPNCGTVNCEKYIKQVSEQDRVNFKSHCYHLACSPNFQHIKDPNDKNSKIILCFNSLVKGGKLNGSTKCLQKPLARNISPH